MESSNADRVTVAGWKGCPYFARSRALLAGTERLAGGEVLEFGTRAEFKDWLKGKAVSFGSDEASAHASCPFVFQGGRYIGGNDAFQAWVADLLQGEKLKPG